MATGYFPAMTALVCRFQSFQCVNLRATHRHRHTHRHTNTHIRQCVWAGIRCLSERTRTQSGLSFNGWENFEPGVSESASLPALPLPLPAPPCSWTQTIKPSTIAMHNYQRLLLLLSSPLYFSLSIKFQSTISHLQPNKEVKKTNILSHYNKPICTTSECVCLHTCRIPPHPTPPHSSLPLTQSVSFYLTTEESAE